VKVVKVRRRFELTWRLATKEAFAWVDIETDTVETLAEGIR